jgi:hypothetical protein
MGYIENHCHTSSKYLKAQAAYLAMVYFSLTGYQQLEQFNIVFLHSN